MQMNQLIVWKMSLGVDSMILNIPLQPFSFLLAPELQLPLQLVLPSEFLHLPQLVPNQNLVELLLPHLPQHSPHSHVELHHHLSFFLHPCQASTSHLFFSADIWLGKSLQGNQS
ncbi:hypothetical protein Dimus_020689 [Dionaea muscipula]